MAAPDQALSGEFTATVELTPATSAQVVVAGTSGKTMFITNISISTDTAGSYRLISDGNNLVLGKKWLPANGTWSKTFELVPRQVGIPGHGLKLVCSASSGNVTVDVDGYLQ